MKNIEQILKEAGIEVTDEQKAAVNKAVTENYRTINDYNNQVKKAEKAEGERDTLQKQYDDAQETIKGFDGVDIEKLNKDIADWKERAEKAEKDAQSKIYERDYADALKTEIGAYKFTSEAAKRDVMAQVKAAGLKLNDGKLLGLSDLIGQIKKSDATAFVDEEAEAAKKAEEEAKQKAAGSAPKFTDKSEGKPAEGDNKPTFNFGFTPIRDVKKGD